MSRNSQIAFAISLALFALIGLALFYTFSSQSSPTKNPALKQVSIQLNMFQVANTPVTKPSPKPVIKPATKLIKKTVKPKKAMPPKPVPKKIVTKPAKPKKHTKPTIKPIEKPFVETTSVARVKPVTPPLVDQKAIDEAARQQAEKEAKKKAVEEAKNKAQQQAALAAKAAAQQVEAQAEKYYLQKLQATLAIYAKDTYPNRAYRRRWQGRVTLQFTLHANGQISDLTIISADSREIFNDAAKSIFTEKMAMQYEAFPKTIKKKNWVLAIPIVYQIR